MSTACGQEKDKKGKIRGKLSKNETAGLLFTLIKEGTTEKV
jgi:hypothetical protein